MSKKAKTPKTNLALILRESADSAKKRAPRARAAKAADAAPGRERIELQLISIRLPKSLVEQLKRQAGRQGIGYQPFIRQILMNQANVGEKLSAAFTEFSEGHPGFQRMLDTIEERFTKLEKLGRSNLAQRIESTEDAVQGMRQQLRQVETNLSKSKSKLVREVKRSSSKIARRVAKGFQAAGGSR